MKALVKKKDTVTLSNTLNEMFFPEKSAMTLQELRFIMLYLAKINPENPDKTEVSFTLEEYSNLLGVELNENAIKHTTRKLLGYTVDIKEKTGTVTKDGKYDVIFDQVQIFKRSKFLRRKYDDKFFLTFECHEELKEHIFNLRNEFTSIEVWNIINLRNFQDARMYMLLRQFKMVGERTIEIPELKEMLAIDKDAYPQYKELARTVLKKCQRALKERSDLCFEFEAVGRPAHSVRFTIFKNKDYTPPSFLTKAEEAERAQLKETSDEEFEQIDMFGIEANQPQISAPDPETDLITTDNQKTPADLPNPPERKLSFAELERIDVAEAAQHGMGSDYEFTVDDMLEIATGIIHSDWWRDSKTEFIGTDEGTRNRKYKEVVRYTEAQYAYTKSRSKSKSKDGFKKYLVGAVRGNYAEVEVATDPKSKAKTSHGSFDTDDFFVAAVKKSMGEDFDPRDFEE